MTGDVSVWTFPTIFCSSIVANGTHTLTHGTSRHHNVHKNAFRCFTKTLVDAKVSVFFLLGIEPTSSPGEPLQLVSSSGTGLFFRRAACPGPRGMGKCESRLR